MCSAWRSCCFGISCRRAVERISARGEDKKPDEVCLSRGISCLQGCDGSTTKAACEASCSETYKACNKDVAAKSVAKTPVAAAPLSSASAAGALSVANRDDVEQAMRRALPSATCQRDAATSQCNVRYPSGYFNMRYISALRRFDGNVMFVPAPDPQFARSQVVALTKLLEEFGFTSNETNSCLTITTADVVATKSVAHEKMRMSCLSGIHPDYSSVAVSITLTYVGSDF